MIEYLLYQSRFMEIVAFNPNILGISHLIQENNYSVVYWLGSCVPAQENHKVYK